MDRAQLEHVIRAAAAIVGADSIVIIGSQSILGPHPDAPPDLLHSIEADVFTLRGPADAEIIDGVIGEESPFHTTFGYYAHGVGPETATLPDGWKDRLVPVKTPATGKATGLCLEAHDLAVSKLVAGREKDMDYVAAMLRHGLASAEVIEQRLAATPITDEGRRRCTARLRGLAQR